MATAFEEQQPGERSAGAVAMPRFFRKNPSGAGWGCTFTNKEPGSVWMAVQGNGQAGQGALTG